jgi:hypothetical protein
MVTCRKWQQCQKCQLFDSHRFWRVFDGITESENWHKLRHLRKAANTAATNARNVAKVENVAAATGIFP